MKSLLTILLCISIFNPSLFAQCSSTMCTTPVPAVNAQNACILPNPQALHCYYGATTSDQPVSFPPSWCTDINNNHWFAFIANSPSTFFTFHVFDCTGGPGIQVALLSTVDCINFQTVAACNEITTQVSDILFASGLTPGQVYYLCIDGTAGALCGYSINGPDPSINVVGSADVCIPSDPIATYSTAGNSTWTVQPPGAGSVVGLPVSNLVPVEWQQSGPAQVCAQSVTCPTAPLECLDVLVGGGYSEQHVDLCAGKTVSCAGKVFSTPGMHEVHFDNGTGCDSTVLCIVHIVPVDTTTETHAFCPGDSVYCAGKYFHTPGTFPVLLTAPQGCDSLVNCIINIQPVVTPPAQVINLCGPASYQVCGTTYSTSGLYAKTCISALGCDSLVTLDLAILQPVAQIVPPGSLDCGPNAVLTLGSTGSSQNTAPGGVTLYAWSGPGIVGPGDQATVQVNKPGAYCLVVTHGRGGVFCADTTCVTVNKSSGGPAMPLLAGSQQPCAGTTTIYTATATGLPVPTAYAWTVPGNVVFTQLSPDSIAVHWPDTAVAGDVCVVAGDSCGTAPPACLPVTIQALQSPQMVVTCRNEPVFLGGAWQNSAGVFSDTLTALSGCDSIVVTTLIVYPVDSVTQSSTTCDPALAGVFKQNFFNAAGCDSVVITTVSLLPSDTTYLLAATCNAANVGVFIQNLHNQYGCDSTVFTTRMLLPGITQQILQVSCNPADTGVFIQNLHNQSGCDSIVITTVTLSTGDTTLQSATTCDPAATGVFTENLFNQDGCDSLVITTVTYVDSDTTLLNTTTCDPAAAGTFSQLFSTVQGCDSLVVTTVTYVAGDTLLIAATTCNPAGAGVFTENLLNQQGCDSLVVTTVTYVAGDTLLIAATTCNPAGAGVFTENLHNQYGCDSLVITTISLLPSDQTAIQSTTCDPAAAGVFVEHWLNAAGCDSTVTETVVLLPVSTTLLNFTTCDPGQAGTVSDTLSNQYGCDSIVTSVTTLVPPSGCGITATLTGSTISCQATTGALTVTATLGEAPFDYVLFNGGMPVASGVLAAVGVPQTLNGWPAGNYSLQISSANGSGTTLTATIGQMPAPAVSVLAVSDYHGYAISCANAADGMAQASAGSGVPPYHFTWSNGDTGTLAGQLSAGAYTVTVTDGQGCSDSATLVVGAPPALKFSLTVNAPGCFGEHDGAILVNAQGGVAPYQYALGNGAPQSVNLFAHLDAGTYAVTVWDANACAQTEIILVHAPTPVFVELGDNSTIELGESTVLQALVNVPPDSILSVTWSPIDSLECAQCLSQSVTPFVSTTYSVVITALNGCSGSDQTTVIVDRRRYLFTPNVFSPNGDGENDRFRIFARPGSVRRFTFFRIYDRWGEAVYSEEELAPDDPAGGWDGRLNGRAMDPGVFVWVLKVEFVDGQTETFQGDVTLVR